MSLRQRCEKFLASFTYGKAVSELMEFVESERGRAADSSLEDSMTLIMYFADEADREEFIKAIHEAKPNMISKKML